MKIIRPLLSAFIAIIIILIAVRFGSCKPILLTVEMGNLETDWLFSIDPYDTGIKNGWMNNSYNDFGWKRLMVPGNWESQGITDPRPGQPPKPKNGLPATDYDGIAWYRIRVIIPQNWADQKLLLHLGSIDDRDMVYINGTLIGSVDPAIKQPVTVQRQYTVPASIIKAGKENVLAIRVDDGGGPGGMIGPYVFLLPEKDIKSGKKLLQSNRSLKERFTDPPADCRMLKIIHSWPDDPNVQDGIINSLVYQGFGGVVCNVSFDEYLRSEAKWNALKRALNAAKKFAMALWLYDEKGYPSGTAGNQTMTNNPEWEVRGLISADETTDGEKVELTIPAGKLILAAAYPINDNGIDRSKAIDLVSEVKDGELSWQPPSGRWHVMAISEDRLYDHTFAAASFGDRIPYINLLMSEPAAKFIELTHKKYAEQLGSDLGKYFISTFTDEPSLMNRWVDSSPYRAIPWSPDFANRFRAARGYDITPLIPLLMADFGVESKKAKYDYWKTVGELVSENFFGQIQDFCEEHNILSGGHLVQEESINDHVAFYGNFFQCTRRMDAPSIDCLTSLPNQVPPHIGRLVSSAADLEGKTTTMSETSDFGQIYRASGDNRPVTNVTADEMKGTCNRLMLSGINTITSYYSFAQISGKQISYHNNYIGRCCTMLRGGYRSADIAVLYPAESIWPKFNPARSGPTDSPGAMKIEQVFNSVSDTLYVSRREFGYIDSKTIIEAKVENGTLVYNDLKWRILILPNADTLPIEAWRKLREFHKSGGVLIAVGTLPANSEIEFPSAEVRSMAAEMFNDSLDGSYTVKQTGGAGFYLPSGSEIFLLNILDSIIDPDIKVDSKDSPLRVSHKRVDQHDIYFIINDSGRKIDEDISVSAIGEGEIFDPSDGKISAIDSGEKIRLRLDPYGAVILRFAEVRKSKIRISDSSVKAPEPIVLHTSDMIVNSGEFVSAKTSRDAERSKPDNPVWKTVGTLTKGQTDTFSMAAFNGINPDELADSDFISFDIWIPENQKSPARLLVVLSEEGDHAYYTDTGRSLNMPGYYRISIPFSHFQLAPWSKDPQGSLDLKSVRTIVIGWGGYFGKEGEKLEFSFTSPHVLKYK